MTRPTVMDKDKLAAFVDGELSPEEAAVVVMHLADHPADQAFVDDLMAANAALSQAFAGPMTEPVPTGLRDLILGEPPAATVLPFRSRMARHLAVTRRGVGLAAGAALAAGLALAVFLTGESPIDLAPGPLAGGSPLDQALTTLAAGAVQVLGGGTEVMILGSVSTPGGFCREIEVVQAEAGQLKAALACTEGAGWTVEVVIAETLSEAAAAEGFGTASGDEAQGFAPFLDRLGAGDFLGPDEEAAAITRGWQP